MRSWLKLIYVIAACGVLSGPLACDRKGANGAASTAAVGAALPEFPSAETSRWVNGAPSTLAASRGSVVLVEVWHPS